MNKKDCNGTLTARQDKAIAAVLEARNVREGLGKAKVSPSVFYAWMRTDETFRAELERRRRELTDEGYHALKTAVLEAANTILELVRTAEGESVRLRAAETILDRVIKLGELEDIEARLAVLEKELKK